MKALLHLAAHSAWNRRATLALVVLSIALATLLLLSLERMRTDVRESFSQAVSGTDLVVGARTGSVQLMLYAVFRIGGATNNIRMSSVKALATHRAVDWVVPMSLGDSHRGLPVLGTSSDYFQRFHYADRTPLVIAQGRAFAGTLDGLYEAVIGAEVASALGYTLGQKVTLTHGSSVGGGLEKHFPEVKVIKLEQNYRSTNHILKSANAVIQHNARRRGKNLWSAKGDGDKLLLQCFEHDDEEARVVAENIEYDRLGKRIGWGDQAILFRTNQQARPLETALRKAKIRYHLIGGQSYFDRREVRDFLAYLKTFLNPHDDIALLRIANTPARGLSDVTMERVLEASHQRNCSVFATMRHTDVQAGFQGRTAEAMREFLRFIEETRAPIEADEPFSLGRWAEGWLLQTGYLAELQRTEKTPEAAESRMKNLRELIETLDDPDGPAARRTGPNVPAAVTPTHLALDDQDDSLDLTVKRPAPSTPPAAVRITRHPSKRLDDFLEELTLDHEREEDKEAGDAVTLITVHAAKGLEFPHVHLVGLEDGLMPHSRSKVEGTMDEERHARQNGACL